MKKNLKNLYWFFLLIIYLESIYRIFIFNTFISLDFLNLLLFSIPISILFYIICNLFNEKVNRILTIILTFIITFIFAAQIVYFNFYQSMFSVFSIMNGTAQVMEFADDIFKMVLGVWYIIILLFVPFVLFIIFGKKFFSFRKLNLKKIIAFGILTILFYGFTFLEIQIDKDGPYSLNRLYYGTHAPMITAKKVGLLTMTRYDIIRFFFGFEEKSYTNSVNKNNNEEIVVKYNKLDINFQSLITNETNGTIKSMHEYFNSLTPTTQNKYTGTFKDKNLIFITAEGFDTLAVNETLTPTLYKLSNNGFVFENYYQPLFPVSTSDGEYMNDLSLIPKEGVWSFYRSSKIYLPFAIGNMFNQLGYKTNAYHDHNYKYYDRNLSHPNMGFTYKGCGNGLQKLMNCKIWPESDFEMMKVTVGDYIYNLNSSEETSSMINKIEETKDVQHFATYYMTVSGHLNYSRYGNSMSNRNWSAVKDLPYSDAIKAYIACNIEFDKAMEYLLNSLEEAGILDDTLIVISPDHYPYGLKNEKAEMSEILGYDRTDKFENFRTTLIMYNPKIKKVVVDKYASSIDILPTVYNLFGLDFDSRLLMGRDILSNDEEGLVILSDRSWKTEKGSYNAIKDEFIPSDAGEIVSQEYIDEINSKVAQKFSMSSLILSNNYYSYLGLKNENTEE